MAHFLVSERCPLSYHSFHALSAQSYTHYQIICHCWVGWSTCRLNNESFRDHCWIFASLPPTYFFGLLSSRLGYNCIFVYHSSSSSHHMLKFHQSDGKITTWWWWVGNSPVYDLLCATTPRIWAVAHVSSEGCCCLVDAPPTLTRKGLIYTHFKATLLCLRTGTATGETMVGKGSLIIPCPR